ncbi:MAG: hypothetical protein LLF94_12300 [Chlamydiales bacterium]|nr:hypothetical protein [Chlamydiales bacterium]
MHQKPLIPTHIFVKRLVRTTLIAIFITALAVFIGMVGYRHFEGLSWVDSFENASMILSGMGQVAPLQTNGGKIFASIYALFSGTLFLVLIAIVFAPVIHRFLHKFHITQDK